MHRQSSCIEREIVEEVVHYEYEGVGKDRQDTARQHSTGPTNSAWANGVEPCNDEHIRQLTKYSTYDSNNAAHGSEISQYNVCSNGLPYESSGIVDNNKYDSTMSNCQSQEPFVTRRASRVVSRHFTEISHFDVDSPIPQMLNYFVADEVEAAIACGRIYGPEDASFVAGEAIKRAGIVTLYDSGMIPTFESDLEVAAYCEPFNLEDYKKQIGLSEPAELDTARSTAEDLTTSTQLNEMLTKKPTTQRRKLQCC